MASHYCNPRFMATLWIGRDGAGFRCRCGKEHSVDGRVRELIVGTKRRIQAPCGNDIRLHLKKVQELRVNTGQSQYKCPCGQEHALPKDGIVGQTLTLDGPCKTRVSITYTEPYRPAPSLYSSSYGGSNRPRWSW